MLIVIILIVLVNVLSPSGDQPTSGPDNTVDETTAAGIASLTAGQHADRVTIAVDRALGRFGA